MHIICYLRSRSLGLHILFAPSPVQYSMLRPQPLYPLVGAQRGLGSAAPQICKTATRRNTEYESNTNNTTNKSERIEGSELQMALASRSFYIRITILYILHLSMILSIPTGLHIYSALIRTSSSFRTQINTPNALSPITSGSPTRSLAGASPPGPWRDIDTHTHTSYYT